MKPLGGMQNQAAATITTSESLNLSSLKMYFGSYLENWRQSQCVEKIK